MDDLEKIRQRRLQELQQQQAAAARDQEQAAAEAQAQAAREEAAIESFLQKILEPEARERLTLIRMSRPDFADGVARQLVALAQAGKLARRVSDEDLRQILAQLTSKDRDIRITRK